MIIKSLSRSSPSFASLYDYLTREAGFEFGGYNLYADSYDREALLREFKQNAEYIRSARGKNYLYHEILSLNKNSLSQHEQEKILQDIADRYILLRAENHLAFSALHKDKEHTHIHLMISANELEGSKRVRLSKRDFATIQKELEQYINHAYPELESTHHYQKRGKDRSRSKNKEQELKQRSKKATKKDQVRENLREIFRESQTTREFKERVDNAGFEFYTRGKHTGVIYEGKKYRLETLGITQEYEEAIERVELSRENEQASKNESFGEKKKSCPCRQIRTPCRKVFGQVN